MNIREITGLNPNYFEINREERNLSAIFFSALCRSGNTERFLESLGVDHEMGQEFGIYFEYAYLRDLWSQIGSEDTKREVLRKLLHISGIDDILKLPFKEFNRKFGVAGNPSSDYVQSPGSWSIRKFNDHFESNDDFLRICRFKWSFNIKPDIVIQLDRDTAICIEAKHTSSEGSYPSSSEDKEIFRNRELRSVGQMELQKYMMEELIGIEAKFIFLVSKPQKSSTHQVVTWHEAFSSLDMSETPHFAAEMVRSVSV
jgi:hypothetical protein